MALVLPILLLLVLGIIQYGLYFHARQGGSDAVRDAARRAAVGDPVSCEDFRELLTEEISSLRSKAASTVITRDYVQVDPDRVQVGDTVEVRVAFDSHDLNIPIVPMVDDGRVDMTVTARVEFVPEQPEDCA